MLEHTILSASSANFSSTTPLLGNSKSTVSPNRKAGPVCKLKAFAGGLMIPNNSLAFVLGVSQSLASSAPHLTIEFLKEWTIGFTKVDPFQKTACLLYVGPWLANLEVFAKPQPEDGIDSVKQVDDIVRSLISITSAERKVCLAYLYSAKLKINLATVPVDPGTCVGCHRDIA